MAVATCGADIIASRVFDWSRSGNIILVELVCPIPFRFGCVAIIML